ncbi:MAG: arsenate reductase [Flavobacteriia bacterium]|nr:arsenate reductase [Flavobacteriia bacterium]OIP46428.1 MAG: arsenate reductase [Flavobacteriaceae bacterium CG2_30_31_66]PIV96538.1 MAG: arsenate reductase [Flavobacteriaceae bacterium CG17_big_fil_post_rev_8_21_14_2_50_31_13]PIX12431.1 MAG: arsenate reductase [Flavobacteriaceae bacterium CG_4_8_14_3_um_filter_31_8]PIY16060.1 MAG: arsenate reductase [Flavobacteriaceae bacterium CG_4_10_14_3_um_filter_31_253]PIZ09909.1 MAG: arsenate reductase [Flavobacteriaceae bacterium CG_4_10_14_0_8_um_f
MKKIYFLQTCDTCRRILKEVSLNGFELQEVKAKPINVAQLEELFAFTKSYEALFNKRAKLYKEKNIKNQNLSETDYRQLILDDYTFLKRPVFIVYDEIFVGNSKKVIENLKAKIG